MFSRVLSFLTIHIFILHFFDFVLCLLDDRIRKKMCLYDLCTLNSYVEPLINCPQLMWFLEMYFYTLQKMNYVTGELMFGILSER